MMRSFPERQAPSPAGHWSPTRDRATQRRFRQMLIRRDGEHCTMCPATTDLQAHHTSPTDGMLLCRTHHRLVDPYAR